MISVTKSSLPSLYKYSNFLKKIWKTHWLTNDGEYVRLLESQLEDHLKIKHLNVVSNGTLALQLVLKALNLTGEVVTTPFTFSATTNVLCWEGIKPVYVDINPNTFNLDPDLVERKINSKTTAILAVHVYGNPCYVEKLEKIAKKNNIYLIFDAAHAFGVDYKGKSVLNYGDVSTLSFHATKVFHTIEGGAVVTRDKQLYKKIQLLRNHGIKSENEIIYAGTNAKMNEFQAAMGLCNLQDINQKIKKRKKIYEAYIKIFKGCKIIYQNIRASNYNYAYMPVCFENENIRNRVYSAFVANGIKARKYFWPLMIDCPHIKNNPNIKFNQKDFKNAKRISSCILCLPIYPELNLKILTKISVILKSNI